MPDLAEISGLIDKVCGSRAFAGKVKSSQTLKAILDLYLERNGQPISEKDIETRIPFKTDGLRTIISRLRQDLENYYRSEGRRDHRYIKIPKGRENYSPEFETHDGLYATSTGRGREAAFQQVRERAKQQIIIVGTGMTNLAGVAQQTLEEHLKRVPIDVHMPNPEFIDAMPRVALPDEAGAILVPALDDFFRRGFTESLMRNFNTLREFAITANKKCGHRITLTGFNALPTFGMTMIDPDLPSGEAVLEFYMFQCGEYRPRLHVTKSADPDCFFERFRRVLENLKHTGKRIVE